MISSATVPADRDDEIDLVALWRTTWKFKFHIALSVIICGLGAVYLAFTVTPVYRAAAVIAPAHNGDMGVASSLTSQLGGLAGLAGVNLGGGGSAQTAGAVLESRRLIEEFITRNNLLPQIFQGSKAKGTLWFAVQRFQNNLLTIRKDPLKGTTTVEVEWIDPQDAAHWANAFVALANELIRNKAIEDSRRNIAYLNDQIARTNVVELQHVMYNLVESETKTLMLANGKVEYAFTVIDPAVPPEIRSSPRRTLIVLLGAVIGIVIGVIAAFIQNAWTNRRRNS